MIGYKPVILMLSLTFSIAAVGQKDCGFKIDSTGIYFNENLDDFLSQIEKDDFINYKDKNSIPHFIKKELDCLTGDFSIANPGEEYQCCCTSSAKLPVRKLLFLSKSNNILIMTYLTGGFGLSTHVLFIKYLDEKIVDLWNANCLPGLKSRKEIVRYINHNRNKVLNLHPNFSL